MDYIYGCKDVVSQNIKDMYVRQREASLLS